MPDRDWDKELAKVDKQLASLSDEALLGPSAVAGTGKGEAGGKPPKKGGGAVASGERPQKAWAMYARLGLSVVLGAAMVMWPYDFRCGLGLAAYLAAVAVVVTSGIWSAVWTWRHRASRAHTLSLLIVLWGLILGSIEILPRVGYAKPDIRHPADWACK